MIAHRYHRLSKPNSIDFLFDLKLYPWISGLAIAAFLVLFQPFQIRQTSTDTLTLSLLNMVVIHSLLFYLFASLGTKVRFLPKNNVHQLLLFVFIVAIFSKTSHVLLGLSSFKLEKTLEWMYASFLVLPIPHLIKIWGFKIPLFFQRFTPPAFRGIPLEQIGFLKAMENYVEIWYEEGNEVHHQMIRSTLKSVLRELEPDFLKCHRSFLVNQIKIHQISVNARGGQLILILGDREFEIPVSGKKHRELRHLMK